MFRFEEGTTSSLPRQYNITRFFTLKMTTNAEDNDATTTVPVPREEPRYADFTRFEIELEVDLLHSHGTRTQLT